MRILDRYVFFEFIRNFAIALVALALVFFLADYLRGVWDEEISAFVLLKYGLMNLPAIACQMAPPAAMIGTMVTLSLLNRKNELTAMHAAGVSLMHISVLIFGAIFIASCLTLVVHDRVVPPLARARTAYYWKVIKNRPDFSMDIKTSKIWYRSKNYIYNLRTYDKKSETIHGIGIYFFDSTFRLIQHVEAENAKFEEGQWDLRNGMLTIFPEDNRFPLSKHFDQKKFTLPETPSDFLQIEKQVESLRLKELRRFIQRNQEAGLETREYEVDFHARIAVSFISLVMGLLAIPYSVRPKRQGGLGKDLAVCVGWIFSYWLLFSISLSLGRSGALAPWVSVWGPSALFFGAALTLVTRVRAT
ncbi:MAG TPA: LPS export ABC transporter permease LptG [Oligoflexia bacterium]|nr:LPS export ABC transporter permease LptG [Oligoflexia bacterium]